MEERLQVPRAVMFGSLGVGFAISVPWIGWWPMLLVVAQVTVYALLKPWIRASERPEIPIGIAVASAQLMIALGVATTGGTRSPLLMVFLLGVVGLPARFGTTGVVAGVIYTEVLIFGCTAGVDPGAFADHPAAAIVIATATCGLAAFAHALMAAESQQRSQSVYDDLTGLPNRRGMEARFDELRAAAVASGAPVAILLCDLDLFKSINDEHGHQRGDAVLTEAAQAMRRSLRPTEGVFRVGGEEFLVLLPGCDLERALPVA